MKKYIFLVLLLAVAALADTMQAQDNPLQRKIDSLNNVTKKQDELIKVKTRELNGNAEIKRLQAECDKRRTSIGTLQKKISSDSLKIDSIQSLLAEMRRPCDSLRAANATLERYKDQVNPLVKRQLSQMATTVDNTWLSKTYAEIDMANLSEELKLYGDFKDQDKGVATAYKKLVAFGEDVMLYKQGVEIVNCPYDANRIAAIMQPFENLVNKERHTGRKAESATVLSQLKGYSDCLKCFQKDIIEEIDEMLESYKRDGTSKKAWKQLRSFLESADGSVAVKKVSQIPWLEKQYRLYVSQLEVDPYGSNPVRETIKSLVP